MSQINSVKHEQEISQSNTKQAAVIKTLDLKACASESLNFAPNPESLSSARRRLVL